MSLSELPNLEGALCALVQMNTDSYQGLKRVARNGTSPRLTREFQELAMERSVHARELRQFIQFDGDPAPTNSLARSVRDSWARVQPPMAHRDVHNVLVEAEQGERSMRDLYREVLSDLTRGPLKDILLRQYANIKAAHQRICEYLESLS